MSRGCYKAYGRKLAGPAPTPSIQFDSLFCDKNNSNKPTASKSTGTVGKWGITSFTSIRSSNFTVGLSGSCKRPRGESKIKSSPTIVEPPVAIPEEPVAQPPKPKKFFKSRNAPDSAAAPTSTPHHPAPASKPHKPYQSKSPKRPQSPPPPPASRQYVKASNRPVRQASIAASKKLVDLPDQDFEEEFDVYPKNMAVGLVEELPVESVHKIDHQLPSPPPEEESAHPPIVLRIFKGTAQLLTDGVVQDVPAKKEGRRRSHGSDSGDSISPKRHKSKHRDVDVDKVVEPEIKVKSERENLGDDEDREMREVEQCLQEANDLLAATENIDCKISRLEKPVDKKTLAELERVKLLRVLEDEEPSSPSPTPPAAPPLPAPPPPSDDLRSASSSFSPPPPPPQAVPTEGAIKQESGPAVVEHQSQPEDELLDDNRQWVADHYKPPPAVKLEDQGDVKVEPLVLRRPSAGGMTTKPPKKGSIFKSRGATGEKRNARYIHNWSDQKEEAKNKVKNEQPTANPYADDDFETESIDSLRRVVKYPAGEKDDDQGSVITSVTCSKEAKEYYTVVRNVKKVHQLQESGEFQEFNDDVEYILDALQDNNPISTRCLSAISLASKCMVPAFRMHVRAHGTVTKFFRALHDATKDQRLGMCTATVMFVLCQDRLNMDIDRDSLELMLNLLESDASHSSALEGCGLSDAELAKTKDRVRSLCQEIQEQGHAKHLNLDNITVGQLAMETLLSLTSRRAGEWFKEELRELGGLEHIIKTVVETCRPIDHSVTEWTPQLLERLKKADRCLKVLENVSLQNEENNNYLLTYGNGILVDTIVRIFHVCDRHIKYYPTTTTADKESMGAVIKECLIANLKVLINLTHDYGNKSFGSSMAGSKEGIIEASLHTLLEVPQYVPEEQKFDVTVLALILLINLVEHCEANRKLLIDAKTPVDPDSVFPDEVSAVKALINMFLKQEELARTEERKTDAILDGDQQPEEKEKEKEKAQKKTNEDAIEETVQLLLQKAGRHMEHTLVGAYIALLLGYLIIDNESYELFVRDQMPNKNYSMLLSVLQKFYNFMTLTAAAGSGSSRGIKATERLIKRLSEIDQAINNGQQSAS